MIRFITFVVFACFLCLPLFGQSVRIDSTGITVLDNLQQLKQSDLSNIVHISLPGISSIQKINRTETLKSGYNLLVSSEPQNPAHHSTVLFKDKSVTGVLHLGKKRFGVRSDGDAFKILELKDKLICGVDEIPLNDVHKKAGGDYAEPMYEIDDFRDTTTVDVLLLYTTDAKTWADTSEQVSDIQSVLALNESYRDQIISNSKLPLKIRFVSTLEIADNSRSSSSNKLSDMYYNTYQDAQDTVDIHALRDQYGADLVSLIDFYNDGTGGIAYRSIDIGANENGGFSVLRVQQMHSTYVLMHELGHNFGNAHGRTQNSSAAGEKGGLFHFSTGHLLQGSDGGDYVTLMHYTNIPSGGEGTRIPHFSNPRVNYLNAPTGSYSGTGGPSDNALSMNVTKNWVSSFRYPAIDPPSINLVTTSVQDTVFPAGLSNQKIIIENNGQSNLEVKADGEMQRTSSLKQTNIKNIKQPIDLTYGFEQSEDYEKGTYSGYRNWNSLEDSEPFEITDEQAYSGTQSLKFSNNSVPARITSPYFSTNSRFTSYSISFRVFMSGSPNAYLQFPSSYGLSARVWVDEQGNVLFYGADENGNKTNFHPSGLTYSENQWYEVQIDISSSNNGTVSYTFDGVSRTYDDIGFQFPEAFQIYLPQTQSGTGSAVYIDNLTISAEDQYGPALSINHNRITIAPGDRDTLEVEFFGNGYPSGVYSGNIYLETNDAQHKNLTIPVDLTIDPKNDDAGSSLAFELDGSEGFRLLSPPVEMTMSNFLNELHTQGATGADVTNGDPNVWKWKSDFSGSDVSGWEGVTDLNTPISPGQALLVYVYNESVVGDSTSRGFPKLLSFQGDLVTSASPDINTNADGFTLIGNPFASTIDWDLIERNDVTDVIYIWNPSSDEWNSYNGSTGDISDGLIKPFQGFLVQTSSNPTSPSLSIDSDDISEGGTFYGKEKVKKWLKLQAKDEDSGKTSSTFISLNESSRLERDSFDALQLPSLSNSALQLWTESADGVNLDINSVPDSNTEFALNLVLRYDSLRKVTLNIAAQSGFDEYEISLLSDGNHQILNSSTDIDLSGQGDSNLKKTRYLNGEESQKNEKKFILHFKPQVTTALDESASQVPLDFELLPNYPNPFNPSTNIRFGVPFDSRVKISVLTILGQQLEVITDSHYQGGYHSVPFRAQNYSSGIYLYRLESGNIIKTGKMLLIK